ncbi:Uncharacterized protein HZ326_1956 [Fusarium oxysporum f. sp. albedinis]|nr:Uncharacterized protein HZ326_1956 [Fusarium oxysporum f. sp. albedinis]
MLDEGFPLFVACWSANSYWKVNGKWSLMMWEKWIAVQIVGSCQGYSNLLRRLSLRRYNNEWGGNNGFGWCKVNGLSTPFFSS